jgi:hypothetical protein
VSHDGMAAPAATLAAATSSFSELENCYCIFCSLMDLELLVAYLVCG